MKKISKIEKTFRGLFIAFITICSLLTFILIVYFNWPRKMEDYLVTCSRKINSYSFYAYKDKGIYIYNVPTENNKQEIKKYCNSEYTITKKYTTEGGYLKTFLYLLLAVIIIPVIFLLLYFITIN